ncbi:MAG TPA: arsenic resistance N-acetyltransferase ArsN2 [Ferruginibacter sp.]|nr:arsenic resistance N-acetyltransferase ArsN2 [Ferruginibacter sp.]HNA00734.1 arsenic resistance N-acetyltransferase ArsN2 [Ferruginibacter sp.]HNF00824.1 arsenic resistance N-acetyltransferase ArsN2 [Ferruginibacter sp.]HNF42510.1 arsenic resistance N-acetyltransferase ArsN2 [Ferruginibacter sp.]HNJ27558.1 arsenic resistance N-acetyltransferase ArsN2 [Ferruginibacter sp.]
MQPTQTAVLKIALSETERTEVMRLLADQKLPVTDIREETLLYLLQDEDQAVGTAGLDIFEDCALLRSISVVPGIRGKGYGKLLNEQIESFAKDSGISCLYLITHTAKDFFDRQGYCVISRDEAPEPIRQTDQFSSLCPSTAVVMKKRL